MMTSIRCVMLSAILLSTQVFHAKSEVYNFDKYGLTEPSLLTATTDTLPADFPSITVNTSDNPARGLIFMENLGVTKSIFYILVLDSTGSPYYYNKPQIAGIDFKPEPNGLFSYASPSFIGTGTQSGPLMIQNFNVINYILDSSFTIIDSVQMQNGYLADFHEFQMLPNGHYLLISYDNNYIDMSRVIEGGNPNAKVIGTVIQELDNNKNCVFQWRSLDHYPITDSRDNLKNASFEHAHVSSLYLDTDGNLIVSLVATAEIIKIDMVSGKILWRLGGLKNDFNISGEHEENAPDYFSMQHDVKRLDNGNLLFYDNGPYKIPWYSRAVEYSLDETNKTASLVWEFRHTPDISGYAMGSAQRLSNGNTLINWGLIFSGFHRTITEVTPDNKIAYELSLPSDAFSYRASKYEFPLCLAVANVDKIEVVELNTYKFDNNNEKTGVEIYFNKLNGFLYNTVNVKKFDCPPINVNFFGEAPVLMPCRFVIDIQEILSFDGEIRFDFKELPPRFNPDNLKIYYRQTEASGTFTELSSHFDENTDQVVANISDHGEFVIGFKRNGNEILPPSLLSPIDKQVLIDSEPVKLIWSPTGRYDKSQLQVSDDSLFTKNIIDNSEIKTPIVKENFESNKTYYWRTKTIYNELASDWSDIHSFSLKEPLIELVTPNGGETWFIDTVSNIIRWKTNLPDSVSITLFRNGIKQTVIEDTLFSYTNAYAWKIPKNVPVDSTYRIKIISLKNSSFYTESDSDFTIKLAPTGVNESDDKDNNIETINYPNPANHRIKFKFKIDRNCETTIKIYDMFGRESSVVFKGFLTAGNNNIEWDASALESGNYIYRINYGINSMTGKIVIIK
ncbi:MAG: T9SS type A sorting domain-containing protein [Bacteroidetes bacterium]|nr:MAG: T9SS type A sorting domain-containing protein [Bacteroidota bacterium]